MALKDLNNKTGSEYDSNFIDGILTVFSEKQLKEHILLVFPETRQPLFFMANFLVLPFPVSQTGSSLKK